MYTAPAISAAMNRAAVLTGRGIQIPATSVTANAIFVEPTRGKAQSGNPYTLNSSRIDLALPPL